MIARVAGACFLYLYYPDTIRLPQQERHADIKKQQKTDTAATASCHLSLSFCSAGRRSWLTTAVLVLGGGERLHALERLVESLDLPALL